jgi:hypothetical protein
LVSRISYKFSALHRNFFVAGTFIKKNVLDVIILNENIIPGTRDKDKIASDVKEISRVN